jgi:hypothetical protein
MTEPQYFVVVFGDPEPNRDPVDSGVYTAGEGYPPFSTASGDVLLLYCTEGYGVYQKQVPGIGVVLRAELDAIYYRWIPFTQPIPKTLVDDSFEPGDSMKMRQLGIKAHRVFKVSKQSFARTVASRVIAWDKL